MYGERLDKWERAMEWPLTAVAVIFLGAYAWEILAEPTATELRLTEAIIWSTWFVFLVDYVTRICLAQNRWRWFRRHLLDLAIVALPMLRPLRLMRFLVILALIQRSAGARLRGRVVLYTVGATALTIVVGALAVYDAEHEVGNIQSFGDAVWWAFVTMTTVGYGDYYPVTVVGRIVAVGMMIGGVALVGVVTATLASWIVQKVSDATAPTPSASEQETESLRREIADLKDIVRSLTPSDR